MKLVEMVYSFTKRLPDDEKFGLISQLKRASISIPSNIAEGSARKSDKELIQFCFISLGSIAEVETQFILSHKLFDLPIEIEMAQVETSKKLTLGFIKYLKSKTK